MTQSEAPEVPAPGPAPAGAPSAEFERRRLHPSTVVFGTITIARRLVVPAVIAAVSRGDRGVEQVLLVLLAILTLPAFVFGVFHYFAFRYRLGPEELVIDSGVLFRQHRVIPLSRVQNVDLRESALQRLLGVVELHVETAGAGIGTEASLEVLSRADAEALREELLARRRAGNAVGAEDAEGAEKPVEVLARLTPERLVAAGATANQAGLIAAALVLPLQFIDEEFVLRRIPFAAIAERVGEATWSGALWGLLVLAAVVLVLGWILSIVGSVIGYHDFTLERAGGELRKRYGLIGRRHTTVPLERVQVIRIEESLLRRPFGLATMKIETAGGAPGKRQRGGAEAFVPIARVRELPALVRGVFDDLRLEDAQLHRVHPRSRRRGFVRYTFVSLAGLAIGVGVATIRGVAPSLAMLWWIPVLVALSAVLASWQYRHRAWGLLPGYALARSGVLNRITWIVPDRKIQAVHLTATPFQRRFGLATLLVDTAGGGRQGKVIDLGGDTARPLVEELAVRARNRRGRGGERRGSREMLVSEG